MQLRAKPSAKELLCIFEGHIADGTLALCNGLRSYHALFSTTYRNAETMIRRLMDTELIVAGTNYYHTNKDVRKAGILAK